ncbi:MAG: FAD/NAD(P)-binding protein [Methylococcaceae bacterium]
MRTQVIIIGGGLSGALAAMQLAQSPGGPDVLMIEKNPELLGRGVAYQYDFTHQPLNVVAGGMGLFSDKPMDFVEWLESNHFKYNHLIEKVSPQEFIPRKIFGDYVLENLERVQHEAAGRLQIRIDEAISILDFGMRKTVVLASGNTLHADHIVLALGNFPPADLFLQDNPVKNDPRYYANPWSDKVYSHITGDEDILLVGSGLTAVDIVLGLILRKFKGKVTMLSRRGRLPLPHGLSDPPFQILEPEIKHPRKMLLWIRDLIRNNPEIPWPSVLDGLRPFTKKIWQKWTINEKKYFLQKIRPYWEIARHRIPAKSASLLNEMMYAGQLELKKGYIVNAKATDSGIEIVYRSESNDIRQIFHKVINCTGPESNYRKVRFPIISDLIGRGKVKTDELGLGIKCTFEGRIINDQDKIEEGIWCIGPMRKSVLWETTALRELREQATELVSLIVKKQ